METDLRQNVPEDLSRQVHDALHRLVSRQRVLLQRILARHDLNPGQARCLRLLAGDRRMTQREVADALFVSAPTVTRLLQRMERSGLVEREQDPDDQRQTVVRLTPAGAGLSALVEHALTEFHTRSLARLPEQDLRDLARLMHAWCEAADPGGGHGCCGPPGEHTNHTEHAHHADHPDHGSDEGDA